MLFTLNLEEFKDFSNQYVIELLRMFESQDFGLDKPFTNTKPN